MVYRSVIVVYFANPQIQVQMKMFSLEKNPIKCYNGVYK